MGKSKAYRYFAFIYSRRVILLSLEKNEDARKTRLGLKGLAKGFALVSSQEFGKSRVFRYVCHVAKPRYESSSISQPV